MKKLSIEGQRQKNLWGVCLEKCSSKQFDEHQKSGVNAATRNVKLRNQSLTDWSLWPAKFGDQSAERRDAEHLRNMREENTSLSRQSIRQMAENERLTLCLQEAERETMHTEVMGRRAKYHEHFVTACTVGATSQSTLRSFTIASVSSSAAGFFSQETRWKKTNNQNSEEQVKYLRSYRSEGTLCMVSLPKKKKNLVRELPEFNDIGDWKMNVKGEVCSSSSFPTEAMMWINEADSAKTMDKWRSRLRNLIPNLCECSQQITDRGFQEANYMDEQKRHNRTIDSWKEHQSLTWSMTISRSVEQAKLFLTPKT